MNHLTVLKSFELKQLIKKIAIASIDQDRLRKIQRRLIDVAHISTDGNFEIKLPIKAILSIVPNADPFLIKIFATKLDDLFLKYELSTIFKKAKEIGK